MNYKIQFELDCNISECYSCPFKKDREETEFVDRATDKMSGTVSIERFISECSINNKKLDYPVNFGGNSCPVNLIREDVK